MSSFQVTKNPTKKCIQGSACHHESRGDSILKLGKETNSHQEIWMWKDANQQHYTAEREQMEPVWNKVPHTPQYA